MPWIMKTGDMTRRSAPAGGRVSVFYPKQAGFTLNTSASADALWHVVQQIGGKDGYFYANILWSVRARLDDLCGNKITYGRPDRDTLGTGDKIDGWKVITRETPAAALPAVRHESPGLGRLTFTIRDRPPADAGCPCRWHPPDSAGCSTWFAMMPAHLFIFKGMAKTIVKRAAAYVIRHLIRHNHSVKVISLLFSSFYAEIIAYLFLRR